MKYFFSQDSCGHWYCVPVTMRRLWEEATNCDPDPDDYKTISEFESLFGKYRIECHISCYNFENPSLSQGWASDQTL